MCRPRGCTVKLHIVCQGSCQHTGVMGVLAIVCSMSLQQKSVVWGTHRGRPHTTLPATELQACKDCVCYGVSSCRRPDVARRGPRYAGHAVAQ